MKRHNIYTLLGFKALKRAAIKVAENAKKKAQINELQAFVSRFSANASKAKQATSRARAIDKIQKGGTKSCKVSSLLLHHHRQSSEADS